MNYSEICTLLGDEAEYLLEYHTPAVDKKFLHLPAMETVRKCFAESDRSDAVIASLERIYGHGRLADTGYVSILPVDQSIEHSAGASFAQHPAYFDPEHIVRLAIEGGCSAVASTAGILASVSSIYADVIPFVVKLNHNDLLRYPNTYDQIMFSSVEHAYEIGAVGVGATIYFGSPESTRQIQEVAEAFERAHQLGMCTILWCYLRSPGFTVDGVNYATAADLSAQANHIGATVGADILKQKLPTIMGGYQAIQKQESFGKIDERMYSELMTDHPIDLCRYQVLNGFAGRIPLINSGGASGTNDLHDAVRSAVINKRAGGSGLILGRKAFQKPMQEGIEILNAVQDVYLCDAVTIA